MKGKELEIFLNADEAIQRMDDKITYRLGSSDNYRGGNSEQWSLDVYKLDNKTKLVREVAANSWPRLVVSGENPKYEKHINQWISYYIFENGKPVLDSAAIKEKVMEITKENLPSLSFKKENDIFDRYSIEYKFVNEVETEKDFPKMRLKDYQASNKELKDQSLEAGKSIDSLAAQFGYKDKERFVEMLPEIRKNAKKFSKKISLS
ncbi:MAG: hypothetical protein V1678_05420 [Candidatus Aenigmatarchaeota archaeon]